MILWGWMMIDRIDFDEKATSIICTPGELPNDLDPVDADALRRALEMAMRDPPTATQLTGKFEQGDGWREVAETAAYHCQCTALGLACYQEPPSSTDQTDPGEDPKALALLRRMLAAGLSRYEPDPLASLAKARKK